MNKRLGKVKILGHYYEREQLTVALVFLIPVLAAGFFLFILPVFQVVRYSFTDMNTTKGFTKYVGFDNYKYLFDDSKFGKALRNTVVYAVLKLVFDTALALIIALLLDQKIPLRKFIRCSYFAPVVVPVVASSLIWLWFYDPTVGPFNAALEAVGLKPLKWLNSSDTALISVLIFSIWKGVGYNVILFLTGLQNIPDSYIEAAKVDGASNWKFLWRIMVPMAKPYLFTIILLNALSSWNSFMWPLLVVKTKVNRTLPFGLYAFTTEAGAYQELIMAASTVVVLPTGSLRTCTGWSVWISARR